jgi:hypothetical protein
MGGSGNELSRGSGQAGQVFGGVHVLVDPRVVHGDLPQESAMPADQSPGPLLLRDLQKFGIEGAGEADRMPSASLVDREEDGRSGLAEGLNQGRHRLGTHGRLVNESDQGSFGGWGKGAQARAEGGDLAGWSGRRAHPPDPGIRG